MAFISSAKMLLRFNDLTLIDSVSSDSFSINGGTTATFRSDNTGMVMERDKYIYMDSASLSISNKFTIGFWLTPTWPGMGQNPDNSLRSMKINLLDIGNGSVSGGNVAITAPLLTLQERTIEGGNLEFYIDLGDGAYTAQTYGYYSPYDAHHFWIVYDGTSPSLTLYIDGGNRDLNASGAVPASISATSPIVSINRMIKPASDTISNKGIIDEFVILNDAVSTRSDIQKAMNNGIDYLIDDSLSSFVSMEYPIMFDDPAAVRVNGSFNDGAYIYLAKSNGDIARGAPKFWEVRKEYANDAERRTVQQTESLQLENDFLRINDGIVSL